MQVNRSQNTSLPGIAQSEDEDPLRSAGPDRQTHDIAQRDASHRIRNHARVRTAAVRNVPGVPSGTMASAVNVDAQREHHAPAGSSALADVKERALIAEGRTGSTQPPRGPSFGDGYNTYAKYASAIIRQFVFGESRFNNSKIVPNTLLALFQKPGGIVPPGLRLGILGGTRMNAAMNNLTRAASAVNRAIEKVKAGKDPTDDIASAVGLMGEGLTEILPGFGTDFGNYLEKKHSLTAPTQFASSGAASGQQPSQPPTEPAPVLEEGTGTPIPAEALTSATDQILVQLPPPSAAERQQQMDSDVQAYTKQLDDNLHALREREKQKIFSELERTPDAAKPIRLNAMSAAAERNIQLASELADSMKADLQAQEKANTSAFETLGERTKAIRAQLKSGRFTDADVAGLSRADAAHHLGVELLACRRHEEEIAQSFEMLAQDALPQLADTLQTTLDAAGAIGSAGAIPGEARSGRLQQLKEDYRQAFAKYQDAISKPTDQVPEIFRISKALKAQIGPAALNTAFATVDFGARIDDYIKKVKTGTATEEDSVRLASAAVGLVGGMSSFIPVVGPVVSIMFSIAGIALSSLAESLPLQRFREKADALRNEIVDEYQKKYPDSVNYVYRSDVGAG